MKNAIGGMLRWIPPILLVIAGAWHSPILRNQDTTGAYILGASSIPDCAKQVMKKSKGLDFSYIATCQTETSVWNKVGSFFCPAWASPYWAQTVWFINLILMGYVVRKSGGSDWWLMTCYATSYLVMPYPRSYSAAWIAVAISTQSEFASIWMALQHPTNGLLQIIPSILIDWRKAVKCAFACLGVTVALVFMTNSPSPLVVSGTEYSSVGHVSFDELLWILDLTKVCLLTGLISKSLRPVYAVLPAILLSQVFGNLYMEGDMIYRYLMGAQACLAAYCIKENPSKIWIVPMIYIQITIMNRNPLEVDRDLSLLFFNRSHVVADVWYGETSVNLSQRMALAEGRPVK